MPWVGVMRTLRRGSLYQALGAVFAVVATLAGAAIAQSGPLVRIIVPFPPGGSADVLARVLSQQIEKTTKQTIMVENRPGAGASIAYEITARAVPDGNTIVVAANSVVINPHSCER